MASTRTEVESAAIQVAIEVAEWSISKPNAEVPWRLATALMRFREARLQDQQRRGEGVEIVEMAPKGPSGSPGGAWG